MAAPQCGLTIVKKFTYRGAPEEWSNHYMFTGPKPADTAAWRALFDALVLQEKKLYPAATTVVAGYGYDAPPHSGQSAVWSIDMSVAPNTPVPGTYGGFGDVNPGDSAVWIRWGLDRMNTKGKRVYLRKYYHPGLSASAAPDLVHVDQLTALNAFGAKMRDGTFLDGRVLTDRLGTALVGTASSPYITTRTLKRRGKRPPTT